jgi:hypothetical protein
MGFSKMRSAFILPRFTGADLAFKPFIRKFERYAAIQGIDAVLSPDYPTSPLFNFQTNKLFYYAFQEAVSDSSKATRFFNVAPRWDGHGAYYSVYNGFTFTGTTSANILLSQLSTLRIEEDESVTDFVLRLQVLFDDLENVPGKVGCTFNDMQKIQYLLQTIRHEPDLAYQHTYIQTSLSRNTITFEDACNDLLIRDDTLRADEAMNASSRPRKALSVKFHEGEDASPARTSDSRRPSHKSSSDTSAMISTAAKKSVSQLRSDSSSSGAVVTCLAEGCDSRRRRGFCRRHYIELVSGKVSSISLQNGWGVATFEVDKGVIFPPAIPEDRQMRGIFQHQPQA